MPTSWTKLSEASGTTFTKVPKAAFSSVVSGNSGIPIGLLAAITYADSEITSIDPWTSVTKASGTVFTNVAKAT